MTAKLSVKLFFFATDFPGPTSAGATATGIPPLLAQTNDRSVSGSPPASGTLAMPMAAYGVFFGVQAKPTWSKLRDPGTYAQAQIADEFGGFVPRRGRPGQVQRTSGIEIHL